jgi:DNA repair protein RecN (Recombination protein N)
MLKELSVKNFAIIEDINVSFNDNMTVLTGETGAGKSLIIDTISLLLGARADSDMIRYNESKAVVKGVFSHNE